MHPICLSESIRFVRYISKKKILSVLFHTVKKKTLIFLLNFNRIYLKSRAGTIPRNMRYSILNDIRYLGLMRYRCQTIFDIFNQNDTHTQRYPITSKSARLRYKTIITLLRYCYASYLTLL